MFSERKQGAKVVGVKQTRRAVQDGTAAQVFLAEDADPRITQPVEALCAEKGVPVRRSGSMKELVSTASTFLLVGLAGVDLGEHQKKTIPMVWAISLIMLVVGVITGGISI